MVFPPGFRLVVDCYSRTVRRGSHEARRHLPTPGSTSSPGYPDSPISAGPCAPVDGQRINPADSGPEPRRARSGVGARPSNPNSQDWRPAWVVVRFGTGATPAPRRPAPRQAPFGGNGRGVSRRSRNTVGAPPKRVTRTTPCPCGGRAEVSARDSLDPIQRPADPAPLFPGMKMPGNPFRCRSSNWLEMPPASGGLLVPRKQH
jgi:hypothetical protein